MIEFKHFKNLDSDNTSNVSIFRQYSCLKIFFFFLLFIEKGVIRIIALEKLNVKILIFNSEEIKLF